MILYGQLERSFGEGLSPGNFLTLRGLAGIKDLASISYADDGYQRNLQDKHGKAMKDFLSKGTYTFFPEIILSVALPIEEDAKSLKNAQELYNNYISQSFRKTKFNNFILKTSAKSAKVTNSPFPRSYCMAEFTPLSDTEKILQRIDGNHRLSVADELDKNLEIPYCIIFYVIPDIAKKINRVLFNNINFKSVPLTSEENLRLIFEKKGDEEDAYIFPDDELKDPIWFGKHYIKARTLYHQISLENLPNLKNILQSDGKDKFTRTALLELIQQHKKNITQGNLRAALKAVDDCYKNYPQSQSQSYQLLVVHLYYFLQGKLPLFCKWVKDNHIYKLEHTDPASIIEIFDYVIEAKNRTIFLAMPFCDEVKQNHKAIEYAVDDVNRVHNLNLKLKLIRIDDNKLGYSFQITEEILKNIEEGGYLIADITGANPNVYYEIGYQMGLNRGKNQEQSNFLIVHNGQNNGGENFLKDKHFNIANISIEAANDSNDLRSKVKNQLEIYYGLSNE